MLKLHDEIFTLQQDVLIHWNKMSSNRDGWVEVVSSPIVAVSLVYTYHPIPPLTKESPFLTPEEIDAEEAVLVPFKLIPLRPLRSQLPQKKKGKGSPSTKLFSEDDGDVNLSNMEPDIISLEIEVGPSVAYLYGSLVRNFLHLKVMLLISTKWGSRTATNTNLCCIILYIYKYI